MVAGGRLNLRMIHQGRTRWWSVKVNFTRSDIKTSQETHMHWVNFWSSRNFSFCVTAQKGACIHGWNHYGFRYHPVIKSDLLSRLKVCFCVLVLSIMISGKRRCCDVWSVVLWTEQYYTFFFCIASFQNTLQSAAHTIHVIETGPRDKNCEKLKITTNN